MKKIPSMTNKLAWKSFEQNLKIIKHSLLMSHDEYSQMYKTLDQYFQEQTWLRLSQGSKTKDDVNFQPFLYGPKDSYERPFLLTLVKLLLELHRDTDGTRQKDSLGRVYQWYKANKKLLDPEIDPEKEHEESKQKRVKSPIPSLQYTSRPSSPFTVSSSPLNLVKNGRKTEKTANQTSSASESKLLQRPNAVQNMISPRASPKVKRKATLSPRRTSLELVSDSELKVGETFPSIETEEKPLIVTTPRSTNLQERQPRKQVVTGKVFKTAKAQKVRAQKPSNGIQKEDGCSKAKNKPKQEQLNLFPKESCSAVPADSSMANIEEVSVENTPTEEESVERTIKVEINKSVDIIQTSTKGNNFLQAADHVYNDFRVGKNERSKSEIKYIDFLKDQENKKLSDVLRGTEMELYIEKDSLNYNVHFLQEKPTRTAHVRTSGPVQPDTLRYQWTEHSLGGRTHIKNINKHRRNFSSPLMRKLPTVGKRLSTKQLDPKVIASIMVVKHLGEKRDMFKSDDHSVAQWIIDHPELYLFDTEYVKFTKTFSCGNGYENMSVNGKPTIDLTTPSEKIQSSINHPATYYKSHDDEQKDNNNNEKSMAEFPMKTHGKGMPLLPRSLNPDIQVTDAHVAEYNSVESKLPHGACSKDALPLKKREINVRIGSASRCSSAKSRSRSRCSSAKSTSDFKISDFHHFCCDGEFELDDDTQLQRQAYAAINIQKIFRGHMVRKYMRELKMSNNQRSKKRADALSYAQKKYRQHHKRIKEIAEYREPNIIKPEWEKEHKARIKQQQAERKTKTTMFYKKQVQQQAKQNNIVKNTHASEKIFEIFHDNGPSKAEMKQAAIKIQRIVRGWLVRKNLHKAKEKALKRTLDFGGFVKNVYISHCEKIMKRYGIKDPHVVLQFRYLLEYIERRNKYEVEFDRVTKNSGKLTYGDAAKYFASCDLHPSKQEMVNAMKAVLKEKDISDYEHHSFTKAEIVDISFQIYVPKGTNLKNTRKSTWMNPLIDGEEAIKLIGKKGIEESNMENCLSLVQKMMRERNDMTDKGIVPILLPDDAKREGYKDYVPKNDGKNLDAKTKKTKRVK